MKNILVFIIAILVLGGCAKTGTNQQEEPSDKWNGYFEYYKDGEVIHTLWAGKHIDVGTVTYGLDNNANFYATYQTTGGWEISETHMYAGDKKNMPVNKPGRPKIGHFPYAADHSPRVTTVTYTVPLSSLPPAEDPGFAVATHCVVHGPGNQEETGWGHGDYKFVDKKDWGWYDIYFFNQPSFPYTILYGTQYTNDTLKVYLLDVTNGGSETELIWEEYVGETDGTYDATAFDVDNRYLFFTNYNTNELYVNDFDGDLPSFSAGTLDGKAASATYYDNKFYYVDEEQNAIVEVAFTDEMLIQSQTVLSTIPGSVTVTDIAMSPAGDYLYMVGDVAGGASELITYNMIADSYATIDLSVNQDTQIAYGSDDVLYAIEPNGGTGSTTYILDTNTGVVNEIIDDDIIIIDPFADLARGPIM